MFYHFVVVELCQAYRKRENILYYKNSISIKTFKKSKNQMKKIKEIISKLNSTIQSKIEIIKNNLQNKHRKSLRIKKLNATKFNKPTQTFSSIKTKYTNTPQEIEKKHRIIQIAIKKLSKKKFTLLHSKIKNSNYLSNIFELKTYN